MLNSTYDLIIQNIPISFYVLKKKKKNLYITLPHRSNPLTGQLTFRGNNFLRICMLALSVIEQYAVATLTSQKYSF